MPVYPGAQVIDSILAVRVGFEPTEPAKVQRFSRPPDSTALAPHRCFYPNIPDDFRRLPPSCFSVRSAECPQLPQTPLLFLSEGPFGDSLSGADVASPAYHQT